MTVRFNCWVEANSLAAAWNKLDEIIVECFSAECRLEDKFTATVLEVKDDSSRTH